MPASAPASRPAIVTLRSLLDRAAMEPAFLQSGLEAAIVALGPGSAGELAAALAADAATCRGPAMARALGRLRSMDALPAMRELLKRPEADARRAGAAGLACIACADSLAILLDGLVDESTDVSRTAAESLVELEKSAPALRVRAAVAQLAERGRNVVARARAIEVVVKLGGPDARSALERMLRDLEPDVRGAAVGALGTLGQASDAARAELLEILESDREPAVRKQAAITLGRLKEKSACPPLIEALSSDDSGLRANAYWALKAISGRTFPLNSARWREWWQREGSRQP